MCIRDSLDITYYCSDSMKLEELVDETFDLVYTSNGVHVWIHDLGTMYRNFHRILKENGRYIMFDTHPWSRPFDKKLLGNGEFRIRTVSYTHLDVYKRQVYNPSALDVWISVDGEPVCIRAGKLWKR